MAETSKETPKWKQTLGHWWYRRIRPPLEAGLAAAFQQFPSTSKRIGPPRGIIPDVRRWVEETNGKLPPLDRFKNHWVQSVRNAEQFIPRQPDHLGTTWHSAFAERLSLRYPELFLVHLRNARIAFREGVILSESDGVFEELTHNWGEPVRAHPVFSRAWLPKLERREGIFATLVSPAADHNYSHWMIDGLLRLAVLEEAGLADRATLIVPDRHPWHSEFLRLLGYGSERLAHFGEMHWELEHLLVPSFLSEPDVAHPWAVEWLRRRVNIPEKAKASLKIYISREDTRWRKLINEQEVIAELRKKGFQIIRPQELSFREQIDLFSRAAWIVGPHGSGFTNLMFAPRHARALEFFAPHYVNTVFYTVASAVGQQYGYLIGTAPMRSLGANAQFDDFQIDMDDLRTVLKKMEAARLA